MFLNSDFDSTNKISASVNNAIAEKCENQHPCHFFVLLHLWLRNIYFSSETTDSTKST